METTDAISPPTEDRLYTASQSRALDKLAQAGGIAAYTLMTRAGLAAFQDLLQRWPRAERLLVFCGSGNNAGDGYVLARLAIEKGLQVRVQALKEPKALTDAAWQAAHDYEKAGGKTLIGLPGWACEFDLIVDALLGTGLTRCVQGKYLEAIDWVNATAIPVLSLDVPSGLCADTGQVLGAAIRASCSSCFIGHKRGVFTADGPDYAGDLIFHGLEIGAATHAQVKHDCTRLNQANIKRLSRRSANSHKGHYGRVMVCGGDQGMGGAALLAAETACYGGSGIVSLWTRPSHVSAALARRPELICRGIEAPKELAKAALKPFDCIVIGPGLGAEKWAKELFELVINAGVPRVIDADALRLLSEMPATIGEQVLTPHPGEAAQLLGCTTKAVQADRFLAARTIAQQYDSICILKGNGSLIAAPDGTLLVCDRGTPALAAAGSGDVLAGLVGSLIGQGLSAMEAAKLATFTHAVAGEQCAEHVRSVLASDLAKQCAQVLWQLGDK